MARPRKEKETRPEMASDQYVSQFHIDAEDMDPDYHYRYVETHCMNQETQSIDIAIRAGYEPVPLSQMPSRAAKAQLLSKLRGRNQEEEYVKMGDQVLMRCPRAIFEKARKAERRESKQQMGRVEWSELSASIKAPTFVSENEYSRTQELSKAAAKAFADDDE